MVICAASCAGVLPDGTKPVAGAPGPATTLKTTTAATTTTATAPAISAIMVRLRRRPPPPPCLARPSFPAGGWYPGGA